MSFREGESFGYYHIRSHIAEGGTGDVYRALDARSGHRVALKIPTKATIVDPSKYEFYLRELDALQCLSSPATQRLIESGRADHVPYLVTELIDGQSLRTMIKNCTSFPLEDAIPLARQIAQGVAYCHTQRIIHRDLKPENILVNDDHQPVIIDFGLALSPTRPTGKSAGTPDYIAPEQIEDRHCDERTDVYAFGATLCEMLSGSPPYSGDNAAIIMRKHLYSAIPRLDRLNPHVSPQVAAIVARCLQRDPARRYPDMNSLISDLDHPDQIDLSALDSLCAAPPGPPFHKHPAVRAVLFSFALLVGIMVLAVLLAGLHTV